MLVSKCYVVWYVANESIDLVYTYVLMSSCVVIQRWGLWVTVTHTETFSED